MSTLKLIQSVGNCLLNLIRFVWIVIRFPIVFFILLDRTKFDQLHQFCLNHSVNFSLNLFPVSLNALLNNFHEIFQLIFKLFLDWCVVAQLKWTELHHANRILDHLSVRTSLHLNH